MKIQTLKKPLAILLSFSLIISQIILPTTATFIVEDIVGEAGWGWDFQKHVAGNAAENPINFALIRGVRFTFDIVGQCSDQDDGEICTNCVAVAWNTAPELTGWQDRNFCYLGYDGVYKVDLSDYAYSGWEGMTWLQVSGAIRNDNLSGSILVEILGEDNAMLRMGQYCFWDDCNCVFYNISENDLTSNELLEMLENGEISENVNHLWAGGNGFNDISMFARFTELRTLYLWDFNGGFTDVTALGGLTELRRLYLSYARINDVTPLKSLINLETLYLYGTPLTLEQVEELRQALPHTEIFFGRDIESCLRCENPDCHGGIDCPEWSCYWCGEPDCFGDNCCWHCRRTNCNEDCLNFCGICGETIDECDFSCEHLEYCEACSIVNCMYSCLDCPFCDEPFSECEANCDGWDDFFDTPYENRICPFCGDLWRECFNNCIMVYCHICGLTTEECNDDCSFINFCINCGSAIEDCIAFACLDEIVEVCPVCENSDCSCPVVVQCSCVFGDWNNLRRHICMQEFVQHRWRICIFMQTCSEIEEEFITIPPTPCNFDDCERCNPPITSQCECKNCNRCGFLGGEYGFGHVTGGRNITIADALAILRYLVDLSSPIDDSDNSRAAAAITNPGGNITIADALAILRYLVDLPSTLNSDEGQTRA
ncbi:MAG: hypothetical protein FWF76_06120 [Oscillospiraceae bacterium]|nr:hypothetical protein [Oscillospiraceae bacterium]